MNSSETVQQAKEAANADPEAIERDIDRTRGRVDETLEELQARLSPGQMLDKALQYVRANGGELAGNLGHQVKANPLPFLLTGVGLVWLMSASRPQSGHPGRFGRSAERLGDRIGDTTDAAADSAGNAMDRAGDAMGRAGDAAGDALNRAGDYASDVMDRIGDSGASAAAKLRQGANATYDRTAALAQRTAIGARRLSDSTAELMREQPLVIGLIGLAAGALIGALLPPTETEDRIAGRAGDRLTQSAKGAVSGAFQHARDAAKDAVDSTRDAARDASGSLSESTRPH